MPKNDEKTWKVALKNENIEKLIVKLNENLKHKNIQLEQNRSPHEHNNSGGVSFKFHVVRKKDINDLQHQHTPTPPQPAPDPEAPVLTLKQENTLTDQLTKALDTVCDLFAPPPQPDNRLAPSLMDNQKRLEAANRQVYIIKIQPTAPSPQLTIRPQAPGPNNPAGM